MPLVIFQSKAKIERKTRSNIRNNMPIWHPMPSAETETGCWFTIVYKSHGKGNLKWERKKFREIIFLVLFSTSNSVCNYCPYVAHVSWKSGFILIAAAFIFWWQQRTTHELDLFTSILVQLNFKVWNDKKNPLKTPCVGIINNFTKKSKFTHRFHPLIKDF